ncbi:hypothetical protein UPYG_G00270350 [Umbra pygmaea]|uniref:RNA cytidine acetyltransferase n=1 Tax=Umbra pygmaea TaxID=75934 RepID=A0ABD0X158_UMBPY
MPSAMNGNSTVQSASPDVGSASGQITLGGGQSSGAQSEAMKQVLGVIDKKVRNMEKKKGKLDDYQARKNKGEHLNQDQLGALTKYQEVYNNLEFARELQKSFLSLGQDIQKSVKKAARREQLRREEAERKRLRNVLEFQFLLDRLGEDGVRQELRQGAAGGAPALLTDSELTALDELYKLVGPERDQNTRLSEQYEEASHHLINLLDGKDKEVAGTTYKALKDSLDRVLQSGYFDKCQSQQNGSCEEEKVEEEEPAVVEEESSEKTVDPEGEIVEEYVEPIEVEATEFVNRQFIPEAAYCSSSDKEQDQWTTEAEVVIDAQQQPVHSTPPPVALEPPPLTPPATRLADPVVRKQAVQDLLSQMQGPYNFMQESMLEYDSQPMDPAIVSAQPMKPPAQNIGLSQMGCTRIHTESRLSPHSTVPAPPEPNQVCMVTSTPPPMYQSSHTPEPRPQTESIDAIQASMSLASEQQPRPSSPAQQQGFQPASKSPHSSGINVNAAPFQSMQTVFNLNAPVPPANETETLNVASQYQNSYGQQGFSSQSQQLPVEQTEMQTEQLQSVVGAFHPQDPSLPSQALSQPQQGAPGFVPGAGRQAQSFYNSRGMTRGGPRNARGMANGYRGPSNGFRGGYDGYRPPFANTPNSGYQQAQFSTPRDYSNGGNYQRGDGYNQNYKRGPGQGPRGVSRGGSAQPFSTHIRAIMSTFRKKIDNRIRVQIENGMAEQQRTMFVIVGNHGKDQVVILHHMLSKAAVKARPSVLWCYKKELGFSSNRRKRMRQLQKKIKTGTLNIKQDDPFELFVAATNIRYCYYKETHKILGNTFGMCVLQDFEAITPNLLARTVETVEGGGIVVILLRSVNSLKQLYTMTMDVHSRYRTEAHQDVVGRFNERFILSLSSCKNCVVIDDQLNILPISSHVANIKPVLPKTQDNVSPKDLELKELKESLQDTKPVGVLVDRCKTMDQAKAVLKFIEAISEKTLRSTVALTAARGRGKSAALGLAVAGSVAFGYSNIFITSPSPDNLQTLFEFVFKGFDALQYQEHLDYEIIQSLNPDFNKAVVRVNIFKEHRQTIQYIHPADSVKLGQAELLVIDEAAAIPLPLVKKLLGPYLVFMASTINGYEGTGRSLSLKLIQQLRHQSAESQESLSAENRSNTTARLNAARSLQEVSLHESIRYAMGDPVEKWLNDLLCLDCLNISRVISGFSLPETCDLYYVNRDTLFCYHKASEAFLQRLMALYVASHYKNSPNDLQMLSDAPAHHVFCLLPPVPPTHNTLPEVLAVVQVCLEGEISRQSILNSLSRGKKASGDLIPWTVSEQFQDPDFASLSGGRVVRIAVHPDYQGMGYGSRALQQLQMYYEGRFPYMGENEQEANSEITSVTSEAVSLLEEVLQPRKNLPPLLLKLSERRAERLDYLGVSYGLTPPLLKFWKKAGFLPVYLRQTPNDLTGEHSCVMLKELNTEEESAQGQWLDAFWKDFRRRFLSLLSYQFSSFSPTMALNILQNKGSTKPETISALSSSELAGHFSPYDLKRLEMYSRNMVDYHLIMDLIPTVARMFFLKQLGNVTLSAAQSALLLGVGLQHKEIDQLEKEIDLPSSQLMGLFNRLTRKTVQFFNSVQENAIEADMVESKDISMEPTAKKLNDDLDEAAKEFQEKHKEDMEKVKEMDLQQYLIRGDDEEWEQVLKTAGQSAVVSIKSDKKRKYEQPRTDKKQGGDPRHGKMKKGGGGGGKKKPQMRKRP